MKLFAQNFILKIFSLNKLELIRKYDSPRKFPEAWVTLSTKLWCAISKGTGVDEGIYLIKECRMEAFI